MLTTVAALLVSCWSMSVHDGDTIKCDGQLMRLIGSGVPYVSGIDTPELTSTNCPEELAKARRAREWLKELISEPGTVIEHSGQLDKSGRPLVRIRLKSGKLAEDILLEEGLARPWSPNHKNNWCSG